jgi:NitT/TauT family transport system permease protein
MTALTTRALPAPAFSRVTQLRIAIIAGVVLTWEVVAASGWLYRDVVPSLLLIAGEVLNLFTQHPTPWAVKFSLLHIDTTILLPEFYWHLWVTVGEVATAMAIGGLSGLAVGLLLGANRFLAKAFEPYLYYLGPTPKIIFFPVMIMWFGVGPGSKVAMGAISCFFPVALSAAAGMRQIDQVLIKVGKSFRLSTTQMVTKIYLPAMRLPILNGVRLGLGVAIIGSLLAETKLSNQGVGFLVINSYSTFNMPRMYALLIVLFAVSIGANALLGRFGRHASIKT